MTTPAQRRAAAGVTTLVTLVALLAAAPPSPGDEQSTSARVRPADRPWTGFAIPRTPRASSGWIGARRVDRSTVVYRTDPRRRGVTRAFVGSRTTGSYRAGDGRRVGPARTSCAALLLGRYGVPARASSPAERRLQVAAVDVAVQHLLFGRGFRHDGAAQRRRTDQRPEGPLIRAYAEKLVTEGCPLAGPYRVTLTVPVARASVGDRVAFTATVRSRTGAPMAGVTVRVTPGDGTAALEVLTGSDGSLVFAARPGVPGPLTAGVVTLRLPSSQVHVLVPRDRRGSRAVRAGLKLGDAYPRSATVAVQGQPTLRLLAVGPVARSRPLSLGFRLGATYPGRRTAVVQVFGPFGEEAAEPRCRPGALVRQRRVVVDADGSYRSDPVTLGRRGRYLRRVSVPGDTYNAPVTVCGGGFRVR